MRLKAICVPLPLLTSLLIPLLFPTPPPPPPPPAENIWAHEQHYLSVKFTFYYAHD